MVCISSSAVAASSLPHLGYWCLGWTSQCCPWLGYFHWHRHPCSKNRVTLLALWQLCPTTSVLLWCRLSFLGSTMATSYLSDILPIFNDASRLYLMLQIDWCSDFVTTTTVPRDRCFLALAKDCFNSHSLSNTTIPCYRGLRNSYYYFSHVKKTDWHWHWYVHNCHKYFIRPRGQILCLLTI